VNRAGAVTPLWRRRDAVGPVVAVGVGLALCVAAWWLAAGDRQFRDQLSLSTVSVLGLTLVLGAQTAWILRGRAAVGRRARALLGAVPPRGAAAPLATPDASALFVAGPGLRRYHRVDCALAAGQGWPAATAEEQRRTGRRPCGICRPDGPSGEARS